MRRRKYGFRRWLQRHVPTRAGLDMSDTRNAMSEAAILRRRRAPGRVGRAMRRRQRDSRGRLLGALQDRAWLRVPDPRPTVRFDLGVWQREDRSGRSVRRWQYGLRRWLFVDVFGRAWLHVPECQR